MSDPLLRLSAPQPVARRQRPALPVGRQLVNAGLISQTTLLEALTQQRTLDAPLGEILVADGHVDPSDVLDALAVQYDADRIDLTVAPPTPLMAQAMPVHLCQSFGVVPWRWSGNTLLVATTRPDRIPDLARTLDRAQWAVLPVIAPIEQIHDQISALYGGGLAHQASHKVPEDLSCRTWAPRQERRTVTVYTGVALLILLTIVVPAWVATVAIGWAVLTLAMASGLKLAAVTARFFNRMPARTAPLPPV